MCVGIPDQYDMEESSTMWDPGLVWLTELNQTATEQATGFTPKQNQASP